MTKERILIVGAGVCGMTVGHELAEAGFEVTIVETQAQIGGLAKTYRYDGFSFDSGPHVFLSASPEVNSFVARVMHDDLRTARMRGAVHFLGRYYDWPLTPRVILGLPPKVVLSVARDIFVRLFRRRQTVPANFEEYILQKYGRTLYELDFGPYTEKFTKLPTTEIHSDWAILGVSRTVIGEKVTTGSLGQIIRMALGQHQAPLLLYSRRGISDFHRKLADSIVSRRGRILLDSRVGHFVVDGGRILSAHIVPRNTEEPCDFVVWTGPLTQACQTLGISQPDLRYLHFIIYNICLRGKPKQDYQWIYYVDHELPFNRIYNTVLFSSQSAPPDHYGLCVEVTCREEDEAWRNPSSREKEILTALVKVGLIDSPSEVVAVYSEKLENAYPLYKTNYREEVRRGLARLQRFGNFIVAGRTGLFWYNTMDHSIKNAFEVATLVRQGCGRPDTMRREGSDHTLTQGRAS